MSNSLLNLYGDVEKATLSGRELEASVLSKAASLLLHVKNSWGVHDYLDLMEHAIKFNQQVWTFFQAELTHPDNPLPEDIKKNLLILSYIVDRRSFDILASPEEKKIDLLISINQNIASGLRGDP